MVRQTQVQRLIGEDLADLLKGGFAPTIVLLREFHYDKAGVMLKGLHFSAWILLGHMQARFSTLLGFMKDPAAHAQVWPEACWPANHQPTRQEWQAAIGAFELLLTDMIHLVQDPETDLFSPQANGKTLSWAAMTALHHNGYHVGQLKTIGRQLGVW